MRTTKIACCQNGEDKKIEIRVQSEKIIKQVNFFSTEMVQEVDTALNEIVAQYEELESIIAVEIFKLKEAISKVGDSLKEELVVTLDLQPYRQLLKQVQANQKSPVMTVNLNLSDINELSRSTLIGELNCQLRKLTEPKVHFILSMYLSL